MFCYPLLNFWRILLYYPLLYLRSKLFTYPILNNRSKLFTYPFLYTICHFLAEFRFEFFLNPRFNSIIVSRLEFRNLFSKSLDLLILFIDRFLSYMEFSLKAFYLFTKLINCFFQVFHICFIFVFIFVLIWIIILVIFTFKNYCTHRFIQ